MMLTVERVDAEKERPPSPEDSGAVPQLHYEESDAALMAAAPAAISTRPAAMYSRMLAPVLGRLPELAAGFAAGFASGVATGACTAGVGAAPTATDTCGLEPVMPAPTTDTSTPPTVAPGAPHLSSFAEAVAVSMM